MLFMALSTGLSSQNWYYFEGQVIDESTMLPADKYFVFIDYGDYQTLETQTDSMGYYVDSVFVNIDTLTFAVVSVYDCFGEIHFESFEFPETHNYANFTICIPDTDCFANFQYEVDLENPLQIGFFDLSSESISKWTWDFGDGNTSILQNPTHQYEQFGQYHVVLIVEDSLGNCWDSDYEYIFLGDTLQCQADFEYYSIDTLPNTFVFNDLSLGNLHIWHWNFGDGFISYEQYPTHTFVEPGVYDVCLTVMDTVSFCSDYYCDQVIVGETPICTSDFETVLDTLNNTPNRYLFNDKSEGNIDSWHWDFGDGQFSNEQNPVHTYSSLGEFNVCLTVSSINQLGPCSDTKCQSISSMQYFSFGGHAFIDGFPINVEENDSSNIATATLFRRFENQWKYMDQREFWKFGYYWFVDKPEGEYLLRIDLNEGSVDYNNYSPSYYINSSSWHSANTFNLTSDEQLATDINFQKLNDHASGIGSISGFLQQGETCSGEITLSNQVVKLFNGENNYVAFDRTNEDGEFEFSSLGADNYRIQAEFTGKSSTKEFVEINSSNPFSENNFLTIDCNSYVGINTNEYLSESFRIGKIYPLPANDFVNIEVLSRNNLQIEIELVDVIGRIVDSKLFSVSDGETTLSLDLSSLHSGVYIYQIKSKDGKSLKGGKLIVK